MNKLVIFLCFNAFAGTTLNAMDGANQLNEKLEQAIQTKNIPLVRALLNQGASVNAKVSGWTPLINAAVKDDKEICELLIEKKALVDERDDSNCTALFRAIVSGHINICELLVEKNASMDAEIYGMTSLMYAAQWARDNICKLLIEKNAAIDAKRSDGKTALIIAADEEKESTSKLLIDYMVTSIKQGKQDKKQLFDQIDAMTYLQPQLRAYALRQLCEENE